MQVMHWVSGFGKETEVLEPRELRLMIYDELKLTQNIYKRHFSISHP